MGHPGSFALFQGKVHLKKACPRWRGQICKTPHRPEGAWLRPHEIPVGARLGFGDTRGLFYYEYALHIL
jgi:hypothetical protein